MSEEKPPEEAPAANPSHVEDPQAPIIYADDCWSAGRMSGDNMTLTFATKILNHTQSPPLSHSKTVLRLVLPMRAAGAMADFIKEWLAAVEKGAAPPPNANRTLN